MKYVYNLYAFKYEYYCVCISNLVSIIDVRERSAVQTRMAAIESLEFSVVK